MGNRVRFMGFMVDDRVAGASAGRARAPKESVSATARPDCQLGPKRFTPDDLTFGPEAQTLEELRAEVDKLL